MDYTSVIFLHMIKRLKGNRTIYGAYHILKGKKSSQTIQDCHLFHVASLFGVFKNITREKLIDFILHLEKLGYVTIINENGHYVITEIGEIYLTNRLRESPIPISLNGFVYHDLTDVFWTRLALFIQCLSFLKANKPDFLPISKDVRIQRWVKRRLRESNEGIDQLANNLYQELRIILESCTEIEATLFTYRLSGYHRVGLSIEQVSTQLQLEPTYARLLLKSIVHRMLEIVKGNPYLYPVLISVLDDPFKTTVLTHTAERTWNLLKSEKTIEEISRIRQLKRNTIEDHIVEIAMNVQEFSIEPFVSLNQQARIASVIDQVGTQSLKNIKKQLPEHYSYFFIRLTLAKKGRKNGFN